MPDQNSKLAVFVLRDSNWVGHGLEKNFVSELGKHRKRPAIVKTRLADDCFGDHLQAVMRKLVRARISRQRLLRQRDFLVHGRNGRGLPECHRRKCPRHLAGNSAIKICQNDNGSPLFGVVSHV